MQNFNPFASKLREETKVMCDMKFTVFVKNCCTFRIFLRIQWRVCIFQCYQDEKLPYFSVLICALLGLCGWCIWRFFRKKRPKDKKKSKDEKVSFSTKVHKFHDFQWYQAKFTFHKTLKNWNFSHNSFVPSDWNEVAISDGSRSIFVAGVEPGRVSHLLFGFGKFPLKIQFFPLRSKISLWVVSKSTWVKDGPASFLLRVQSMLGSSWVGLR